MVLIDGCGRPLLNLRVAITRRCNLRCEYCHLEGEAGPKSDRSGEMTVEEILRTVRIAVELGISKIKLTGGEPLLRADALEIVKKIARLPGLKDLSMTTNGALLAPMAPRLHKSGLKRINISLPTINEGIFRELTGGNVQDVLRGVDAAIKVGFSPVKLNMLILKNINDNSVQEMIAVAQKKGAILQLIELEPVNISSTYYSAHHKPLDEYEGLLARKALKVETRHFMQNRHIYDLPGVQVEVIRPSENSEFCMHCTRLRLTSDGKLKPCLMRNDNLLDIVSPLRGGASDDELAGIFELASKIRQPYIRA